MSAGTAIIRAAIRNEKDEYDRLVKSTHAPGNKHSEEVKKALKRLGTKIKELEEDLSALEEINMIHTEAWMLQKQKVKYELKNKKQ